jgi:hypothetical protein
MTANASSIATKKIDKTPALLLAHISRFGRLGAFENFVHVDSYAPLGYLPSLDHLVCSVQHRLWDRHTDLLRRLQIDHQLELRWLLYRR